MTKTSWVGTPELRLNTRHIVQMWASFSEEHGVYCIRYELITGGKGILTGGIKTKEDAEKYLEAVVSHLSGTAEQGST